MYLPVPTSIVKAFVRTDATGLKMQLPVLVTPFGVLDPLLDYFLLRLNNRSVAWRKKVARAVRLFAEYLSTNPEERDSYRLFLNFSHRVRTGTFSLDKGEDESGLGWRPMSSPKEAQKIINALNDFFDYLNEVRPTTAKFNPRYAGSAFDRSIDEAAYRYRRDKAFLGHTWTTAGDEVLSTARVVRGPRGIQTEQSERPRFPEEHFEQLILEGFRVGKRYDYRNILITVLLHCAGFRESEPFHLFVSDVIPDPSNPKSALVLIPHPVYGAAPFDPRWINLKGEPKEGSRLEYLQERWGLRPRNEVDGYLHAGWKGGIHEQDLLGRPYCRAYWFDPWWGEFFMTMWNQYLEELVTLKRKHPFAFVNTERGELGAMYALSKYIKAHGAAVRRIGLTASKAAGTTPHGHRHAYGKRLESVGMAKPLIRRFMHHSSLSSQDVYTAPGLSESLQALHDAAPRLQSAIDRSAMSRLEKGKS